MTARGLVGLALAGEGALVLIAVLWTRWRGMPLPVGPVLPGVAAGLAAAGVLVAVNAWVLCAAPSVAVVRSMRRLHRQVFTPMFRRLTPGQIVTVSLAAGVGEEILFRGAAQPELGLAGASLLFGVLHVGGRDTWWFGAWVALMGVGLGALAILTDGLLAPVIAHTVYDAAAMSYMRWGRECEAVAVS